MKCTILHESAGRLRVHMQCARMTLHQADVLEYYLRNVPGVTEVKVYDRTQDAVVLYSAQRGAVIAALAAFSFPKAETMDLVPEHTSRALNREFEDKLAMTVMRRCISKLFLPVPITTALSILRSVKYIKEGLKALWHGKLSVAVLDATAVTVSIARGDFSTAGSVMFMLRLGEILEEWTHKKSVADLAGAMSLHTGRIMGLAMGTSEAVGYVDGAGCVSGWFNELAFAPVDLNDHAARDAWSGDSGVGSQYFSQDAVIRLAAAAGIPLDEGLTPAEKLAAVQRRAERGEESALTVLRDIGVYLGHTLPLYAAVYDLQNLLVLGRVASGVGGEQIVSACRWVLAEEYPSLEISVTLPDERFRRVGQSMAAASLPEVE